MTPDLSPLLNPRSIAVVGASNDVNVIRGRLLHILQLRGFAGPIYPVTRSHAEVQGLEAYPSIARLPEAVDLAVIVIPATVVPEALAECGKKGIRAAAIISSGFAEEKGDTGPQLQHEIRTIAARYGLQVAGPNCEGVANILAPAIATFSPALEHVDGPLLPEAGPRRAIGVTAQSGAISFSYFNRGRPRQLRFSYVVSSGNEAVLEGLDYVDWMLDDGQTDLFLMYMEAMRSGARLREVAEKAARHGKPIIVAKVGRSEAGRRAALSHTGSLAGRDDVYDAVFRRYGIVRAEDLDEMLDAAAAFSFCPLPRGGRVGLLTASGGGAVWMADLLSSHGLEVPALDDATRREIDELIPAYGSSQNPVDLTAQSVRQVGYARVIDIMRRSPSVDIVLVVGSLAAEATVQRDIDALRQLAGESDKPIVFCAYTLASPRAVALLAGAGIPTYTSMAGCARALAALSGYATFQRRWRAAEDGAARAARTVSATAAAHASAPGADTTGGADAPLELPGAVQQTRAGARPEPIGAPVRADVSARLRGTGRALTEVESKELLALYGIPRPPEALARDDAAAVAAAERIGYPVALKVQSPAVLHKTEVGALALGLGTPEAVRAAFRQLTSNVAANVPGVDVQGVLVQRMAAPGREVIVGITRDRVFGPMLMVGLGGIWVEVLRDVALAPVPVDHAGAVDLIRRLRGVSLLEGARGEAPADIDALADLLVRVGDFAADHAEAIDEIDLNPVIVHPAGHGLTVVDALIVPAGRYDTATTAGSTVMTT